MKNLILSLFIFSFSFIHSTELKIASYNVENLFDLYYNGTEYERYIPLKDNWTKKSFNTKLKNISEVICEIDADIIGLQEIENSNVLKILQKSLEYYGCRYNYSAITHTKESAIQVALLSKIPIKRDKDITVSQTKGIRNILESKFIIDGNSLYIYVNHWNSKRSLEEKRIKSAIALKKRLLSLPKGSEYILLGDFNSNYNEYKKVDKTGINMVLNSMSFAEESMRVGEFMHYNLWLELLPYKRWSYDFYGDKQGLDSILLPPVLFDGKGIDYINDSFEVFKKAYMFTKKGYVKRWRYNRAEGYSDHLPISALFSTKAYIYKKKKSSKKECKIKELYNSNSLPCLLKNVKIVWKKGRKATISDFKDEIFIYGVEKYIKVGRFYNIEVYQTKIYKGSYEIIDFSMDLLDNG